MTNTAKTLTFAALGAVQAACSAQSIFLECKHTSGPGVKLVSLFKTPPKSNAQVLEAVWDADVPHAISTPPSTWIVDLQNRSIKTPERGLVLEIDKADEGTIRAARLPAPGSAYEELELNRVNGQATYSVVFPQESIDSWRKRNGKAFPQLWMWHYSCVNKSKPAF
jgi:hypothetical protein